MSDVDFCAALKQHRERLDLTQTQAAQRLGLPSLRTWQEWEGARRTPPSYVRRLILQELQRWS